MGVMRAVYFHSISPVFFNSFFFITATNHFSPTLPLPFLGLAAFAAIAAVSLCSKRCSVWCMNCSKPANRCLCLEKTHPHSDAQAHTHVQAQRQFATTAVAKMGRDEKKTRAMKNCTVAFIKELYEL